MMINFISIETVCLFIYLLSLLISIILRDEVNSNLRQYKMLIQVDHCTSRFKNYRLRLGHAVTARSYVLVQFTFITTYKSIDN